VFVLKGTDSQSQRVREKANKSGWIIFFGLFYVVW